MSELRKLRGEWIKKKIEDLIPGDVIKDIGFLLEIDLNPDPDGFWCGKPNMTCYDLNDSYYGPGCREIKETEFEVLENRHDIIDAHNIVNSDLAKHIADLLEYRRKYNEIHKQFFKIYNKKHHKRKKQ